MTPPKDTTPNPSHDVLREQAIDQLKLYLMHGGLMANYGAGDIRTEAEQLFDLVYETYVDAHTKEKVREAVSEYKFNGMSDDGLDSMITNAEFEKQRRASLTNKGKGEE